MAQEQLKSALKNELMLDFDEYTDDDDAAQDTDEKTDEYTDTEAEDEIEEGEITDDNDEDQELRRDRTLIRDRPAEPDSTMKTLQNKDKYSEQVQVTVNDNFRTISLSPTKREKEITKVPSVANNNKPLPSFEIFDTIQIDQNSTRPEIEVRKYQIPNLFCEECGQNQLHKEEFGGVLRCTACRNRYCTLTEYEAYLKVNRKVKLSKNLKKKRRPRNRKMKRAHFNFSV